MITRYEKIIKENPTVFNAGKNRPEKCFLEYRKNPNQKILRIRLANIHKRKRTIIMSDKKYTQQLLDQIFTYHKPSEESIKVIQTIREKSKELAQYIVDNCPDSDEAYTAIQRLQEVSMYANASIARHTPNQNQ